MICTRIVDQRNKGCEVIGYYNKTNNLLITGIYTDGKTTTMGELSFYACTLDLVTQLTLLENNGNLFPDTEAE